MQNDTLTIQVQRRDPRAGSPELTVVVPVKNGDEKVYADCLCSSIRVDLEDNAIEIIQIQNAPSGARAYNAGIDAATADLIVCTHADVAFGTGWRSRLHSLIALLPPSWGVIGAAGTDTNRVMWGTHSGLDMQGREFADVQTLDGCLTIFRRSLGLRFDERYPFFHIYGEDLCLEALARGRSVHAVNLPMEHRTHWTAGPGYIESTWLLKEKWRDRLPNAAKTICTTVSYIEYP